MPAFTILGTSDARRLTLEERHGGCKVVIPGKT